MALGQAIGLAIVVMGLAAAESPQEEATRLNNEAARLANVGKYDDAERSYRAALSIKSVDNFTQAKVSDNLAVLYQALDRFPDAEQMYRRALELRRKSSPPASPEIAHSMNDLAQIYWTEGRYWEARNLLSDAVKLEEAHPDDPKLPLILNNLAVIQTDFHEYRKAEELLRRTLSACEDLHGPGSIEFAIALNNLAQVLESQKDYAQASPIFQKAVGILENLGPRAARDLAGTLANLGHMYHQQNRNEEAERTELRALALADSNPPLDAPLRATILQNLGNIVSGRGAAEASLPYFEQSLAIRQKTLTPAHPAIISLLLDYAKATLRAGRKSLSKQLHKQAQQLAEQRSREDISQFSISVNALH